MTRKILTAVAFACVMTTVACSDPSQQTAKQGGAFYGNDKAGGADTGAPGHIAPAGN